MIGHCGWGEVLFVKDVWPNVPLLGYFEFFYRVSGSDLDFDPEFPSTTIEPTRIRTRNTINLLSLDTANWGQTPTEWQRAQYPEIHRSRISVIHEGIDTDLVHPEPSARLWLRGGASFAPGDEIITYSARNLEPYRGFHTFMRALAKVLEQRPNARAIIVGADGVSYGRLPERAANWREYMLTELEGRLDLRRVSFVGWLPYQQYLAVLQLSSAHVYLTYPLCCRGRCWRRWRRGVWSSARARRRWKRRSTIRATAISSTFSMPTRWRNGSARYYAIPPPLRRSGRRRGSTCSRIMT